MRPTWPLLTLTLCQGLAGGLTLAAAFQAPGALSTLTVAVALAAALAGGVASFFHMHRLAAARYILRRWRTSWLSREAVTTGLFTASLVVALVASQSGGGRLWVVVSAVLGLLALWVTAMLYATIRAMRSWYSPLTVLVMMGVGLVGGGLLAEALATAAGTRPNPTLAGVLTAALAVVWGMKALQWRGFIEAREAVWAATGTGLALGPWRLQDTGTTRPPYAAQTQIWPLLPDALRRRRYRLLMGLLGLAGLTQVATAVGLAPVWALLATAAFLGASLLERWLFFADATHSSRVWFQDQPQAPSRVVKGRPPVGI